jgi:hypothetical protein
MPFLIHFLLLSLSEGLGPIDRQNRRCNNKCHEKALCQSNGECVCHHPYVGDGVKGCVLLGPFLEDVAPRSVPARGAGKVFISVANMSRDLSHTVFCKFGATVVRGTIMSRNMVSCLAPPVKAGLHDCFLSFENDSWTNSSVSINFYEPSHVFPLVVILYLSLIVSETLLIILGNEECSSNRGSDRVQEMLPLNKWHMHGVQEEIGREMVISEFLYNVIIS